MCGCGCGCKKGGYGFDWDLNNCGNFGYERRWGGWNNWGCKKVCYANYGKYDSCRGYGGYKGGYGGGYGKCRGKYLPIEHKYYGGYRGYY